jgi:3-oxoacyl-[acyl-carrier protein] reductase
MDCLQAAKGDVETVDWQAWAKAIEINLYGSVLMCRALLPHFKMRRAGKIIQLSGGGATAPLPRLSAYAVCGNPGGGRAWARDRG